MSCLNTEKTHPSASLLHIDRKAGKLLALFMAPKISIVKEVAGYLIEVTFLCCSTVTLGRLLDLYLYKLKMHHRHKAAT